MHEHFAKITTKWPLVAILDIGYWLGSVKGV